MTAIALEGLTKRFGRVTAVDAVDLAIGSGELFFVLGPSGCGKTTLLRMIAGFTAPTAGGVRFGDREVTRVPPNRRNTGMVFQSYALWPHLSVFDNVAYGLRVRKVAAEPRSKRVTDALRTVRMEGFAQRRPGELSGGQQQRVALARALVIEPTVLLLDEPLSNLDAKLRQQLRAEIRRICLQTRVTTIYVTHDQKEALSMADRVAVMHEGRIAQVGSPRELYERPASRFVADFLGETNFIPAVVRGTDGGAVTLDTAAGALRSTAGMASSPKAGNVTCSLRPESVRLVDDGDAPNLLSGKRIQSIYLGETAQHLIELTDGTVIRTLELNPRPFTRMADQVRLTVDPDDVVILTD